MATPAKHKSAQTWFESTTPQAAFGHFCVPPASLNHPRRAKDLIEISLDATAADSAPVILYVVPDIIERDLLLVEMRDALHPDVTICPGYDPSFKVCILDYGALFVQLRDQTPHGLRAKQSGRIIILCEVDMFYSAPFALSMLSLMQWASADASSASAPVLRVACVSTRGPERALQDALSLVFPSHDSFRPLYLDAGETLPAGPKPTVTHWNGTFVDHVGPLLCDAIKARQSVLFFCHLDEKAEVLKFLEVKELKNSAAATSNWIYHAPELPYICRLMLPSRPGEHLQVPPIIFMTNASRIPMSIKGLGLVVVSNRRRSAIWDRGHVVAKQVQYSAWEIEQATAYAFQSNTKPEGVTVVTPAPAMLSQSFPGPKDVPPRKVDGEQIFTFIHQTMHICRNVKLGDLLSCFLTDRSVLMATMLQLIALKSIQVMEGGDLRPYDWVPGPRGQLMTELLPEFNYAFEPAWFLSGVADVPTTTPTKRAMVRLAAIAHVGLDMLGPYQPAEKAVATGRKVEDVVADVAANLAQACAMPPHVLRQGTLWVALAAWQKGAMMCNNFNEALGQRQPAAMDVTDGELLVSVNVIRCKDIARLVYKLESKLGLDDYPEWPRPRKLELSEDSLARIHNGLLGAWMNQTVCLRMIKAKKKGKGKGKGTLRVIDMVAAEVESVRHCSQKDKLVLELAFGSPGTTDAAMWTVALSMERLDSSSSGEGDFLVSNLVVIPAATIAAWDTGSEDMDFAELILCQYVKWSSPA